MNGKSFVLGKLAVFSILVDDSGIGILWAEIGGNYFGQEVRTTKQFRTFCTMAKLIFLETLRVCQFYLHNKPNEGIWYNSTYFKA